MPGKRAVSERNGRFSARKLAREEEAYLRAFAEEMESLGTEAARHEKEEKSDE